MTDDKKPDPRFVMITQELGMVPLRDYLELHVRRLDDLRQAEHHRQDDLRQAEHHRQDDLRQADKEAVRDTRQAMEKRLEGLNELRDDVAPKASLESVSDAIRRVERLVYIGMGLAIAASVAIPLLLRS